MAKFSFRRYDHQAVLSVILAAVSALSLLGLAFVIFQNYDGEEIAVVYGKTRKAAILAATAITLGLAAMGFGIGLNSAGQRRNDKQAWSWLGFFISAGVLCLAVGLFAFFWLRGEAVIDL